MALRVHDPDGLATRRAIRGAIAVPIGVAIVLYGFEDPIAAAFTLFGTVGLVINSDFAGSVKRRATSYLLTGVAGSIALVLGWAASLTTVSAVLVTMAFAFGMTFVSMFRGSVSIGAAAVLLVYILTVCLNGQWANVPSYLMGWWLAVILSTVTALVLLPRTKRPSSRPLMAEAFSAAAHAASAAWVGDRDDAALKQHVAGFDRIVDAMDMHLSDQPFRTSGITQRESVLNLLATRLDSVRLLVDEAAASSPPATPVDFPERERLAHAIVAALHELSVAMSDPKKTISASRLDQAREAMADGVDAWALQASHEGMNPTEISRRIADHHQMRIFALIVEQMTEMARVANGSRVETLAVTPPVPRRTPLQLLVAQWSWEGPWLRNAIRSAAGLGLGVLVMDLTGVDHGFWVLLGVIAILRFDAVGTRKFALLAILGTAVGAAIAYAIVSAVGGNEIVLWLLLPALTFLAAWAAGAVNFPSGQAAFTAMVLVALALINWPPRQDGALVRVEDIALGAGVALVVGYLLWPRGAAAYLRIRLAASIRASRDYLDGAITAFGSEDDRKQLPALRVNAVNEIYRAGETFDIAAVQRGPVEDIQEWAPTLSLAVLLSSAAQIIGDFTGKHPVAEHHPELRPPLEAARQVSHGEWTALAAWISESSEPDDGPVASPALTSTTLTPTPLDLPTLGSISTTADARDLVIAVWVVDWVRHLTSVVPHVLPPGNGAPRLESTARTSVA